MRYESFEFPFVEDKKPLLAFEATEKTLLRLSSRLPLEQQGRLVVEQNSMQDAADGEMLNLIVMQLLRILDLPIYCYLLGRVLEAVVVALHLMANYAVRKYLEHFAVEVVVVQIVRLQRSAESSVWLVLPVVNSGFVILDLG